MAFPISPVDGEVYTDTTTNRKFVYSSPNSLWKLKGRSELADYTSLSGRISSPLVGDALAASLSGVEFEPAQQVSNSFQARKLVTPMSPVWQGAIDYPSGALTLAGTNQLLIHPSTPPSIGYYEGNFGYQYSSTIPGSSGSTFSYNAGEGFYFSFTIKEGMPTGSITNIYIYSTAPNTDYPSGQTLTVRGALIKGREITQDILDQLASYSVGGRVILTGATNLNQYSTLINLSLTSTFSTGFSAGDTYTLVVWNYITSSSSIPFTIDDWTGQTPNPSYTSTKWQQVNTVVSPALVFPSGITSLQDQSLDNADLPIGIRFLNTASNSADYRTSTTSVYDYYEGKKNQIPDDQNLEIVFSPATPTYSQFLPDKYTVYNSTTSALNYWDSTTSSWVAI